jgi:type II secretion system protein C
MSRTIKLSLTTANHLGNVATLLMVGLLATQFAWWGWHFLGPQPSIAIASAEPAIDRTLARVLLGEPDVASPSAPAASVSGIRLKGVFAVDGRTLSAAIVNTGARDLSVRVGEAIAEGVTLVDVAPTQIVVSRAGVRETITLDRMSAANTSVATSPNNKGVSNFRLNVASPSRNAYALSRSELNNVLQDPNQLNFLGNIAASASGGVQVKDAPQGSLAQKLGLQTGDIIATINGQPVTGPGDLARFYGQFGSTNSIRAEVRRGGAPMLLTYTINP